MKFDKKLEKAILEDLKARKAKAKYTNAAEDHASVAELEKELTFFKAGFVNQAPAEWIERYCEEDDE
ncbi:hypothetical protein [Paenilisteria rocourtiae]|uniref:Uncharacterized protein n=1 Tax=Listeria rocourtiae TaxID=647910 RepID=A0A4R6ZHL0_9LIST|nr:hypothetical protein [Listeria rocourtiae]EUJ46700.1 hypothetical protein PROCOU_11313 [Listeria rocourtiae FSL F6-920]TDR51698.1 hypothetical protein DFP96_1114 [Listeria rocourtiae]